MTTVLERPPLPVLQPAHSSRQGRCDGCPRCDDPKPVSAASPTRSTRIAIPVCKVCGHCVLRGNHLDDAADLDDHPGFGPAEAFSTPGNN